jgi:hypothetical protein
MGESLDVTGLEPGLYYFAIRSMDDGFHVSELSNVAEVRLPPELAPVATVTEPTPEVSSAPESAKQVLEEESVSQEISPVPSPGDSNDVNKPEVWLVVAPSALVGFILVAVILALLRRRRIRAAAVTENRFCIYCGVEYPPFGRYCIKCGRERE